MLSDFDGKKKEEGGRRFGASLAISLVLFALVAAATFAAIAARVARPERPDVEVAFDDLAPAPEPEPEPEPLPPPPPPEARPRARQGAIGRSDGPPTSIPDAAPEEAEGELAEAAPESPFGDGPSGGEGSGDGGGGGPEPAPEPEPEAEPPPQPSPRQVREEVTPPRYLEGCRVPEVPEALHDQAETLRVELRLLVDSSGAVSSVRVLSGHPLIPEEPLLACMRQQRFSPATLPDGTPVPYPVRRRFVFRPSVL